jgi:hypothetical protein
VQPKAAESIFLICALAFGIMGTIGILGTVDYAEAKNSYRLIVYLDKAKQSSKLIPSFKVESGV